MVFGNSRGSILLETALTLPLFVALVFFLVQMSFVWIAKETTFYAAYCGARAALVYNPVDYSASRDYGVVKFAAMTPSSWIAWSLNGVDDGNFKVGLTDVPLSSTVRNQTHVTVEEFTTIGLTNGVASSDAPIESQFPAVKVTVGFDCPLFIPVGGQIVAYFFGARKGGISTEGALSPQGFVAAHGDEVDDVLLDYCPDPKGYFHYSIRLTESCTLAKPWKTDTFPLMPQFDRVTVMGANLGVTF